MVVYHSIVTWSRPIFQSPLHPLPTVIYNIGIKLKTQYYISTVRPTEKDPEVIDLKLGIVGLPNVGKSTLFNAITNAGAQSANYPFCTIEPNVGVVAVPDARLDALAKIYSPKKVTPAIVEFVDIAGLVRGASKGEGLGNKFLSHIREVDAIVHVVRCFEDDNVIHVEGSVDAMRDLETINLELIFADLETCERRIDRARKAAKGDKKYQGEVDLFETVLAWLEAGKPARSMEISEEERETVREANLLTTKIGRAHV